MFWNKVRDIMKQNYLWSKTEKLLSVNKKNNEITCSYVYTTQFDRFYVVPPTELKMIGPGIKCWYIWKLKVCFACFKNFGFVAFQNPLSQPKLMHEPSSLMTSGTPISSMGYRIKILFLFMDKVICISCFYRI